MRLKSCSLLALAAGGMLLTAAPASAETLRAAGATLPFGIYRTWFDCYGSVLNAAVRPRNAACTAAAGFPVDSTAVFAYAPVGSGAGITAFNAQQSPNATPSDTPYENATIVYNEGTTGYGTGAAFFDFAGSDATLTAAQIAAYPAARGAGIQVPSVGTPVAIPVNITGLNINRATPAGAKNTIGGSSGLFLSRRAYCGIFTGKITNWNDPVLTADNNGVALVTASHPIKVYRRADSSGTTFLLSRHLATVCNGGTDITHPTIINPVTGRATLDTWTGGVGTTVTWTAGFTAATGSNGVASAVAANQYAIGYVSPDYTQQVVAPEVSPAPVAANLQNNADFLTTAADTPRPPAPNYTQVGVAGFVAPATNTAAAWGTALDTTAMRNPTGTTAYPITGFTMLDIYGCYATASKANLVKAFVAWYTSNATADTLAKAAGFAPATATTKTKINSWVSTTVKACA